MKNKALLTLAALASAATHSQAFFEVAIEAELSRGGTASGQQYAAYNRETQVAYAVGMVDADRGGSPIGGAYCLPAGVSVGQLADVGLKFINENPAIRHENAAYLLRQSFRASWPCPVKTK